MAILRQQYSRIFGVVASPASAKSHRTWLAYGHVRRVTTASTDAVMILWADTVLETLTFFSDFAEHWQS